MAVTTSETVNKGNVIDSFDSEPQNQYNADDYRRFHPTPETKQESRFSSQINTLNDAESPPATNLSRSTNPFSNSKLVQAEKARIEAEEFRSLKSKLSESPHRLKERTPLDVSFNNSTSHSLSEASYWDSFLLAKLYRRNYFRLSRNALRQRISFPWHRY